MTGLNKVILEYPLQTPNGEVKTVTLRRGKARDVRKAQEIAGTDAARAEMVLISLLTEEKLTPEDLDELDMADLQEVQVIFKSLFFRQAAGTGSAVGNDGRTG